MQAKLISEEYFVNLKMALKNTPKEVIEFLERYCGFYMPLMTKDPAEISYSSGKRDVILTLKTIMRDDITPAEIVEMFKGK